MNIPDFSIKSLVITLLLGLALFSCTNSETDSEIRIEASIGNDCGPADAREVWLRVADSSAASCPASTLDGLRIRISEGYSLDSLKVGTYTHLQARDCRDTVIYCPDYTATVKITKVTALEVQGTYSVFDSTGGKTEGPAPFKATRCFISPLCG